MRISSFLPKRNEMRYTGLPFTPLTEIQVIYINTQCSTYLFVTALLLFAFLGADEKCDSFKAFAASLRDGPPPCPGIPDLCGC